MNIAILTDQTIVDKWIKNAEETNNPEAYYNLGLIYYFGQGVERNINMAISWFLRAAEMGDVDSMNNAASLLAETGYFEQAAEWFQQAIDHGDELAKKNLFLCQSAIKAQLSRQDELNR